MTDTVDISEELLETIIRGEVIEPKHLNRKYAVDRYILEFCNWE